MRKLLLPLLLLLAAPSFAEDRVEPPPPAEPTTLPEALAGSWHAEPKPGLHIEELWTTERGNLLLGVGRTWKDAEPGTLERTVHHEFLRIERRKEGTVYIAAPKDQATHEFRLDEARSGPLHLVFTDPAHDFPQVIEYRLDGERLHVRVAGGDKEMSWVMERREAGAGAPPPG